LWQRIAGYTTAHIPAMRKNQSPAVTLLLLENASHRCDNNKLFKDLLSAFREHLGMNDNNTFRTIDETIRQQFESGWAAGNPQPIDQPPPTTWPRSKSWSISNWNSAGKIAIHSNGLN